MVVKISSTPSLSNIYEFIVDKLHQIIEAQYIAQLCHEDRKYTGDADREIVKAKAIKAVTKLYPDKIQALELLHKDFDLEDITERLISNVQATPGLY